MKRVVLIGCQGMLGQDLRSRLQGSFDCLPVTEEELDISDRDRVLEWFENVRADVLINCAAYTDVDGCETHRDQAMAVNGEAPVRDDDGPGEHRFRF
jgi:dTDP-4-dehydrorhamnose reductase